MISMGAYIECNDLADDLYEHGFTKGQIELILELVEDNTYSTV